MSQRATRDDRWVSRAGKQMLLIGLVLVGMWLGARGQDRHGGVFLLIAGAPLTIIGAAIAIAAWAFRPASDPMRDPFGSGTEDQDRDNVRHN